MKKKVILLLLALSVAGAHALKIEGDSFKKALESRGINVDAESTIATPETGSFQLITIKNDSPNVITYDPKKIASYLEDNGEKFLKKVRLKRMAYGAGALAALTGAIVVPGYLIKLSREIIQANPDTRERGQQIMNRGITGQDQLDMSVGRGAMRAGSMWSSIKVSLLGGGGALLSSAVGFGTFSLLLVNYEQLSPKRIIQEKITIDPGQKVQALLWFKSKVKSKFVDKFVNNTKRLKLIFTSDTYQAMNEALEVGQK